MNTDFKKLELFAWIGEDETGKTNEIGLKQAFCPAGLIPIVTTTKDKAMSNNIPAQLYEQSNTYGKTIRLCKFVFAEEIVTFTPNILKTESPDNE